MGEDGPNYLNQSVLEGMGLLEFVGFEDVHCSCIMGLIFELLLLSQELQNMPYSLEPVLGESIDDDFMHVGSVIPFLTTGRLALLDKPYRVFPCH